MLQAVFPSLWRTKLRDNVLTWTKFGVIVLKNLLLPHYSRTRTKETHYHQSWNYYPSSEMRVLEEHRPSMWLLIIMLLPTQSINIIACTEKPSSWMSAELRLREYPLRISTSQRTHHIYYKYNFTEWHAKAATPRVCIHHFKLSTPLALDLQVSKECI